MKVAVDTYGCTRNRADEEIIKGQLKDSEGIEESDLESSDIVVLNTCGVKNKTQSKMLNRIKRYREEGKKVLVAGCLPKINRKILEERKALMIGPNSIEKIPEALEELQEGKRSVYLSQQKESKLKMDKEIQRGLTGIVPIAEGCLGDCSYCGVKHARGDLESYSIEEITRSIQSLIEKGKKQIYLTGQDTGCYGYDNDENLPKLLREILKLDEDFKIRIGMMNPEHALEIKDELIDIYEDSRIYSFLHLPVQSGSNKVLEQMNRRYRVEDFKGVVKDFKKKVENLNLATDVIVGYPTENESQFQETLELVKETQPDVVNISRFYPRPGTKAEELDPHPSETLKERSRELTDLSEDISLKRNEEYLGRQMNAFITEETDQCLTARAENYKKIKLSEKKGREPGEEAKVKIKGIGSRGLRGEILNT